MARLVVDEVVTTYDMDPRGYIDGVNKVNAANKDLVKSQQQTKRFQGLKVEDIDPVASLANVARTGVAAATAGVVALGIAAKATFDEFAKYDSMVKALESVEGSARAAKREMSDLRKISKAPGIGFSEAVQSFVQLRNSGMTADFSKTLIKEIANANARGGGSVETFQRAMLAAVQMNMKPFLQGEELLQLMEAGIPGARIVKDRFGTADTEQLKRQGVSSEQVLRGIVEELQKLPRVGGGAQNTLDELNTAVQMAAVQIGGALAPVLIPFLDGMTSAIEKAEEAGLFALAVESVSSVFGSATDSANEYYDALIEVGAIGVTLAAGMRNLKENFMGFMDLLYDILKFIDSIPGLNYMTTRNPFSPAKYGLELQRALHGDSVSGDQNALTEAEAFRNQARMQADLAKKRSEKRKRQPGTEAVDQKTDKQSAGASPVENYLQRIAQNTDPLKQLASQVLGGGSLAQNALNRQDLSDLRSGRRSGDPVEDAVRQLVAAIHGAGLQAASFNPGGRQL